jgi:predicted deacylase
MKSTLAGALMGSGLALAQTTFTGDVLSGYPVISNLDITDVPANTISRYWISAAKAQGGLDYFVPIFVARGTNSSLHTGRKLSISASIHGDELNGIPVVGRVFKKLGETVSAGGLNGTVIGIPTLNPNGNIHNQRNFWTSSNNGFYYNLNRLMPGVSLEEGGDLASSYDYTIWNGVWGNTSNIDIAVDLRKSSTESRH